MSGMPRDAPAWLLLAVLLAGCVAGGDTPPAPTKPTAAGEEAAADEGSAPAPVTLAVSTSGTYPVNPGYSPATLSAPSRAKVTIDFTNGDQNRLTTHDWILEGVSGAATTQIESGQRTSVTFTAPPPGEYAFFCSVMDHRQRGMVGTMTVT